MSPIDDHSYLKVCAELASCLSISLSSARRKVDLAVSKKGLKGLEERKNMAEILLKEAKINASAEGEAANAKLDNLLSALSEEENFMVED
tara:strand:- start:61 stop:330 length:270 start_codon:yes stop_codon:yes gene_type:complete